MVKEKEKAGEKMSNEVKKEPLRLTQLTKSAG